MLSGGAPHERMKPTRVKGLKMCILKQISFRGNEQHANRLYRPNRTRNIKSDKGRNIQCKNYTLNDVLNKNIILSSIKNYYNSNRIGINLFLKNPINVNA